MKTNPQPPRGVSAVTALLAGVLSVAAAETPSPTRVVHDLTPLHDATRVLVNPHKGWYHHFPDNHPNKYQIARDADLLEFPGMDHLYIRLAWAYREALRATNGWFQVFEFKNYRLRDAAGVIDRRESVHTLHVNVKRQGDRFHYSAGWRTINPAHEIWQLENPDIPVKFGQWFTVEIFLRPGPAGIGRFLYRIAGQPVFSVGDRDIQYKNSPRHTFEIFKIYMDSTIIDWMRNHGTPCQAWYDDLEIWDAMPEARPVHAGKGPR